MYATQQRARFSEDYMEPHGADIENMDHYLEAKDLMELFYILRKNKSLEVFSDANFCGNWHKKTAPEGVSNVNFNTG